MEITKQQALAELAKRELARRVSLSQDMGKVDGVPTPVKKRSVGIPGLYREAKASADAFVNSASFGGLDVADALAEKLVPLPAGIKDPSKRRKAETKPGKVAEFTSGVAGGIYGGPGQASEMIAGKVLPGLLKKPGVVGFAARRAKDAVSGATSGALYPGDIETRKKSATLGSIISPVAGAGQEVAKPIANRLMIQAIKPAKETLKRIPDFGNQAADMGIWGTLDGMKNKAISYLDDLEPKIQAALKGSSKTVNSDDVINELSELKRRASNINDQAALKAISDVEEAVSKKGKQISLEEANQLKRDLYSALKDSQWGKGVGEIPQTATARKSAAYGLKEGINKAEPSIGPLNKKTGIAAETLEGVSKQQEKNLMKSILPWVETVVGAGGLAINPLITMAVIGRRLANDPTALSSVAQVVNQFGKKSLAKPLTIGAAEMVRRGSGK